jgi:hypothetical protein
MIDFIAEPGVVKTWDQFLTENPNYSIALDGYVSDEPKEDLKNFKMNLDHHYKVKRFDTPATCAQAYDKIKNGLFDIFSINGKPEAKLYINHPDQDVALSIYLFKNYKYLNTEKQSALEELVKLEDKLDRTAGLCDIDINSEIFEKLAWVFQPYSDCKNFGFLDNLSSKQMINIINNIEARITNYIFGTAKKLKADGKYDVAYKNEKLDWAMIIESGTYSKTKAYNDGIKSFVSVREKIDEKKQIIPNNYVYLLFNLSLNTRYNQEEIYKILNKEEGIKENNKDRWGGNEFGGSPRIKGSRISPNRLKTIINDFKLGKY